MSKLTIYYFIMSAGNLHLVSQDIEGDDQTSLVDQYQKVMAKVNNNEHYYPAGRGIAAILQTALEGMSNVAPGKVMSSSGIPPLCPDHGTEMDISKFTAKGAQITYYCKRKSGDRYCQQQADVLPNGVVGFRTGKAR